MKTFAFVLLCALAAVQGRYTGLQSTRTAAALGENPWVVHLRIATSSSGLLNSCVGSLIDDQWVLTAASCVSDARYIWVRYGTVYVPNPSLVTESTIVTTHSEKNIAVININRIVHTTANIAPISPLGDASDSGTVCGFGGEDVPGEVLNCYAVDVDQNDDVLTISGNYTLTQYDIGAPLVSDSAQVGVLVDASGSFLATAGFSEWLLEVTGVTFG